MPHHLIVGPEARPHRRSGQMRRQDRRRAAPVAEILVRQPLEQRVVGHAGEDLPQPIFLDTEPEAFFQDVGRLLEEDHLESLTDPGDVRRWAIHGERGLADNQQIVARQIGMHVDRLKANAHLREQFGRLALGVEQSRLGGRLDRLRGGQDMDPKRVFLGFSGTEMGAERDLVRARLEVGRQRETQRDALLLARRNVERLVAVHRQRQIERPGAIASGGDPRVVDDDDLLLDGLPRQEIMFLGGEVRRLAGNIGQQRPVVADQGLTGLGGNPVAALQGRVDGRVVAGGNAIGAQAGLLQVVPIDRKVADLRLDAAAGFPKNRVAPGVPRRDAQAAEGPPVVGDVHRPDVVLLLVAPGVRTRRVKGIVPLSPHVPAAPLLGFPAEVDLVGLAEVKAPSPRNCEFHSPMQNSHCARALPQERTPLYQPRYMVQLMSQGTPYSHSSSGLTPSVAQCSNQSERSWMGTKSRYRLLVCMLPRLPEE